MRLACHLTPTQWLSISKNSLYGLRVKPPPRLRAEFNVLGEKVVVALVSRRLHELVLLHSIGAGEGALVVVH